MKTKEQIEKRIELIKDKIKKFEDNPQDNIRREFEITKIELLEWVLQ